MKPYFNQDRVGLLTEELKRWKGTTFHYNCQGKATPGILADCVSFPIGVFKNLGLIRPDYETPTYISVRSHNNERQKLFDGLDAMPRLAKIWDEETDFISLFQVNMMDGDIIVCSTGRAIHHLLIYDGLCCWHCWPEDGVKRIPFVTEQIHRTAKRVYRWHE